MRKLVPCMPFHIFLYNVVFVCVCVHVVCVCVYTGSHVCVPGFKYMHPKLILGVFLNHSPFYLLKQGLSLNQFQLPSLASLPRDPISAFRELGLQVTCHACLAFYLYSTCQDSSPYACATNALIHGHISPTLFVFVLSTTEQDENYSSRGPWFKYQHLHGS